MLQSVLKELMPPMVPAVVSVCGDILQVVRDPEWEGVVDGEVCGLGSLADSVKTFLHWVPIKLDGREALRLCASCGDALAREVSIDAVICVTLFLWSRNCYCLLSRVFDSFARGACLIELSRRHVHISGGRFCLDQFTSVNSLVSRREMSQDSMVVFRRGWHGLWTCLERSRLRDYSKRHAISRGPPTRGALTAVPGGTLEASSLSFARTPASATI